MPPVGQITGHNRAAKLINSVGNENKIAVRGSVNRILNVGCRRRPVGERCGGCGLAVLTYTSCPARGEQDKNTQAQKKFHGFHLAFSLIFSLFLSRSIPILFSARPKRQRTGALQDAWRLREFSASAPASWSAAALRRFGSAVGAAFNSHAPTFTFTGALHRLGTRNSDGLFSLRRWGWFRRRGGCVVRREGVQFEFVALGSIAGLMAGNSRLAAF